VIAHTFLPILLALYVSLALGYVLRRVGAFRVDISRPIMRNVVRYLEPAVLILIMWNLDLSQPGRIIALPLLGLGIALLMFPPGWLGARLFGLEGPQRGAFISCAMMSNLGLTMGAFICFLFIHGEDGASLGITWCLYFLPFAVIFMFNLARHYGTGRRPTVLGAAREYVTNPITRNMNAGLLIGLVLKLLGVPKFPGFAVAHAAGIYCDVATCSFAIGAGLHIGKSLRYLREGLAMCVLKFVLCPAIGVALFFALRAVTSLPIFDASLFAVVLIQSSMPVAIFAIVVATLFDLDRDLANACWILSTVASVGVVAVLYFVVRWAQCLNLAA